MTIEERPRRGGAAPKFVSGNILRHILEMTGAGALGLMAIFVGDLANMYFLSLAGDETVIAATGYASTILFFSTSIGIGLSIAATSLVAPAIGANLRGPARRLSTHTHVFAALISGVASAVLWFCVPALLDLLGAAGRAKLLAEIYLYVVMPTLPFLALGMTSSAVLRSVGDAKRAMYITLSGAAVNVALDVVLILGLGWGIEGAAIASALARLAVFAIGIYGVGRVHRLLSRVKPDLIGEDMSRYGSIAILAVLTNVATPVSNAIVTAAVAPFGDAAVAGWAVIGRITPVAFGAIYALSGTVGPIIGQNYGARKPARMHTTLTQSLFVMAAFTAIAWGVLAVLAEPLADAFRTTGEAKALIVYFCRSLSPLFVFLGAMFISNAAFNTLGRPLNSTLLNWGRATLGTLPFVIAGKELAGAKGAIAGNMLGGVVFGIVAIWLAYRMVGQISHSMASPEPASPLN